MKNKSKKTNTVNYVRKMKKDSTEFSYYEKLIEHYRENPVEAARDILNINLLWYQRIQLRELWTKPYCTMNWGRSTAKTFILAVYVILRAILYPKIRIGVIAPSFRQTAFVFDKIELIYSNAPFFRASVLGGISKSNDRCICKFTNMAFIEGLPIGNDGGKIRGQRYNIAILDEAAQHDEKTIELVVRPFLTIMQKNRLNQMIMASSAYYVTNHFYDAYRQAKQDAREKPDLYSCTFFNFLDVIIDNHKDFQFDLNQVYAGFKKQPRADFLMEWGSYFPIDSAAFFTPTLISSCEPRIPKPIEIEKVGDPNSLYVMGIDPARSEVGDNFALSILKVLPDGTRQLVKLIAVKGKDYPSLHDLIRMEIHINNFNVYKICIDYGGGGKSIADLMMYGWTYNGIFYPPIIEEGIADDEIKISKYNIKKNDKVLPILKIINFNPSIIDHMYTSLKADMENKKILFPLTIRRDDDTALETIGQNLAKLKQEMIYLTPVSTARGLNFEGHRDLGKDRITSLVLANYAYLLKFENDLSKNEEQEYELPTGFWI